MKENMRIVGDRVRGKVWGVGESSIQIGKTSETAWFGANVTWFGRDNGVMGKCTVFIECYACCVCMFVLNFGPKICYMCCKICRLDIG